MDECRRKFKNENQKYFQNIPVSVPLLAFVETFAVPLLCLFIHHTIFDMENKSICKLKQNNVKHKINCIFIHTHSLILQHFQQLFNTFVSCS